MPGDWLENFEVRLEALALCARQPSSVLSEVLLACSQAFAVLARGTQIDICLLRHDVLEVLGTTQSQRPQYADQMLHRIRTAAASSQSADATADAPLLGTYHLSRQQTLVCVYHYESLEIPVAGCQEAIAALTDSVAHFAGRLQLDRAARDGQRQQQLVQLSASMSGCSGLEQAARVAVTEGAGIVADCRISLLQPLSTATALIAITGTSAASSRSAITDALQAVALSRAQPVHQADWIDPNQDSSAPLSVLSESGVKRLIVLAESDRPTMIVESFDEHSLPSADSVRQLAHTVLAGLSRFPAQNARTGRRARWLRAALLTAAVAAALLLIPTDFQIEVQGRVQPTRWQRVFAPDDGTIDAVMFDNESPVRADQPLFVMSNPDYRQELGRTLGDIQTTLTEQAAAKTRRLSGTDPAASADEQILAARLSSLEATRDLLQEQIDSLQVTAPFDGTVYLQNPREEMTTRPVRRGQMLLRVVATDTKWQLELDIPDEVRGYVADSQAQQDEPLRVEYLIKAASDSPHSTTLQSVDGSIRLVDSQLICRAVAAADGLPVQQQRPGTSVVARISCGQRSVGFVWFRELVEMWRYVRFAWL